MSRYTKTLLSEKTVFHYTHFRAVFGRMIQFLSDRWIGGKWTEIFPTAHLATLHLAQSFSDIEDDEAQYISPVSNPFERAEYEQTNSVNEIINAIHETNSNSLSAIIINEHEESRWWSLSSWSSKLEKTLITMCCVIVAVGYRWQPSFFLLGKIFK